VLVDFYYTRTATMSSDDSDDNEYRQRHRYTNDSFSDSRKDMIAQKR